MNNDIETRIKEIIEKVRPFLISDGGNLEFVKFEDDIVYVKLLGACEDCPMLDVTLKDGIEELIINEIPEVKECCKCNHFKTKTGKERSRRID